MHTPMDAETRNLIGATLERFVADVYQPPARLARLKTGPVDYRLHWPLLAQLGVLGLAYGESVMRRSRCRVAWVLPRNWW